MNSSVGSRENTRKGHNLPDAAGRAASGLAVAALLTGALLLSVGPRPVAAQNTSPKPATAAAKPDQAGGGAASAKAPAAKKPAAKSAAGQGAGEEKSAVGYAIGVSVGSELKRSGFTPEAISTERLAAGLRDALGGKVQMSQEYQQTIMGALKTAHENAAANRAKEAEPNHAAAATFLAENAKKKDVVTTQSGLQYKVIAPGSGEPPKPGDLVTVNYRGTLLSGTEFDASAKHGGPATFPSNQVIPGWQEALALMKPGAKYQLWIPPKLAYDLDSPPSIPPGSMLIFDVELLGIKPAAGAAGPGAGAGAEAGAQPKAAQPAKPPK
jgi:FKBP-type peptidyl-prolyl cis-trans isomerase